MMNRSRNKAAQKIAIELFLHMVTVYKVGSDKLDGWVVLDEMLDLVKTGMIAAGETPESAEAFCRAAFDMAERLAELSADLPKGTFITDTTCEAALNYQWRPGNPPPAPNTEGTGSNQRPHTIRSRHAAG